METIVLIVGFVVIVLYLYNIDKNLAQANRIAYMNEQERKDYLESINKKVATNINELEQEIEKRNK